MRVLWSVERRRRRRDYELPSCGGDALLVLSALPCEDLLPELRRCHRVVQLDAPGSCGLGFVLSLGMSVGRTAGWKTVAAPAGPSQFETC